MREHLVGALHCNPVIAIKCYGGIAWVLKNNIRSQQENYVVFVKVLLIINKLNFNCYNMNLLLRIKFSACFIFTHLQFNNFRIAIFPLEFFTRWLLLPRLFYNVKFCQVLFSRIERRAVCFKHYAIFILWIKKNDCVILWLIYMCSLYLFY